MHSFPHSPDGHLLVRHLPAPACASQVKQQQQTQQQLKQAMPLQHMWDGKSEGMHADHDLALMLPVTPNSEHILGGQLAHHEAEEPAGPSGSTPFMADMPSFSAGHDLPHTSAFSSMPMLDDFNVPTHFSPQVQTWCRSGSSFQTSQACMHSKGNCRALLPLRKQYMTRMR